MASITTYNCISELKKIVNLVPERQHKKLNSNLKTLVQ
jgi:hypothetical protein